MSVVKEGWTYKKLGDLFPYIKNGANIKQLQKGEGFPITRIETLSGGVFNRDRMGYANIFDLSKYKTYLLQDQDILMSHINSKNYIGRAVLYKKKNDESIIHGMNLLRLIAIKEIINPAYAVFFFSSERFTRSIARIRKDAVNQSSFSITDLKKIEIPIPSLPIQQSIVSELDKINELISLKKSQLKEFDTLAQSIFYEMFGDPVKNEKGWDVKKLGEVCDVRDGTHDSPKYLVKSDYVLITSKNIQDDHIDFNTNNFISREDYDKINQRSLVNAGDIIMAMIGTIGKPIIVPKTDVKFCVKNVAIIKFNNNPKVINLFIKSLLDNSTYMQYIQGLNKGGTQKFVALGTIRSLSLPLPPLSLQHQFAERIESIERMKQQVQTAIKELETLLASRMQYWFD